MSTTTSSGAGGAGGAGAAGQVGRAGRLGLRKGGGRAVFASMLGTLVEWYDYALYGAAASLVIGPLFFGHLDAGQAVAAFATFAVGFIARPFGGLLIAHWGDKHGRKPAMLFTMIVMGISTVGIGLLPTADVAGVWAVVMLIALRLLQGLGAGAELTGAMTLVAEYAIPTRRGLWTSLVMSMPPAGSAVATLAFLAVASLPEEQFYGWGWRAPFLASVVLFLIAIFIRTKLEESPDYQAAMESRDAAQREARTPLGEVLKNQWREVILGFMAVTGHNANNYIISIASITIMVAYGGLERTEALTAVLLGSLLGILLSPLGGMAGDRFGAGRVMAVGAIVGLLFAYPLFTAFKSGSIWVAFSALAVSYGFVLACTSGAQGAFLANLFPVRTRFTGTALARETNGALVAGLTPMIVAALLEVGDGSIIWAAGYMAACFFITFLGVVLARGKGDNKAESPAEAAATAAAN